MSKFERIVEGQIRDTGITIEKITWLALTGSSQADILRRFPKLEAEDIFQALGAAIADEGALQINTLQEIHNEIASIEGYSSIYLSGMRSEELSSEKIVGIIRLNAQRLRYKKMFYAMRARLLRPWYDAGDTVKIPIGAINKELESYIAPFAPFPSIEIEPKTKNIDIDFNIVAMLGFLTQQRKSTINIQKLETKILFRIALLEPFELRDEPVFSSVNLASVIIQRNGGELKIHKEGDSMIFEFSLPIVE